MSCIVLGGRKERELNVAVTCIGYIGQLLDSAEQQALHILLTSCAPLYVQFDHMIVAIVSMESCTYATCHCRQSPVCSFS